MNKTQGLGLRTKKAAQKDDKCQPCIIWLPSYVRLTSLRMVNFDANVRLIRELGIQRFPLVCANIYTSGTASPRSWHLQVLNSPSRRDRTERIFQAEEQILERVEEELDISTHRLAAEVGVS